MAQVAAAAVGAVLLVELKTADMEELGVPIPPVLGVRREQVMLMLAQAELIIYLDVEPVEVAAVGVAQVGQAGSPVGEEEAEQAVLVLLVLVRRMVALEKTGKV